MTLHNRVLAGNARRVELSGFIVYPINRAKYGAHLVEISI